MTHNSNYWNKISKKSPGGQKYDDLLAKHYCESHKSLIDNWIKFSNNPLILKTDLFAEAMCPSRSFLWDILGKDDLVVGMDISGDICSRARATSESVNPGSSLKTFTCDLRKLPFANHSFDIIISDSTLDHYKTKADIGIALDELVRTLKPGGTIFITMDNPNNWSEVIFRIWILLRLSPFYIGKTYSINELKFALQKRGLCVLDDNTLIHNPRLITKIIISLVHRVFPGKYRIWTGRLFKYFDSWADKPSKYLTAQFIAVKAIKQLD